MQDQHQSKIRNVALLERARGTFYCSIAGLAVFLLSFLLTPYLLVEARATTADATVNWSAVSVTLDPDYGVAEGAENRGDVIFGGTAGIHPTANDGTNLGTMVVIKKTIGVTTEGKYYRVFLSTSGKDKNNQYTSGLTHNASDTDLAIPVVGGTWDNPVAFTDAGWGFAVPNSPISKSGSTTTRTDFTQSSTFSDTTKLGVELNATDNAAIYNQNLWAAVPVYGSAQEIWKASTDNSNGFGTTGGVTGAGLDRFDVYYGVMVDTDVLAGTYENNLVYTAIASTDALDAASNNISRSTKLVGKGTTETLIFDLTASTEGLITKDDVHVYLVPHSTIHTAGYKVTSDVETYISTAANNAEIPSSNITSFNPTETGATLILTMPEKVPAGNLKSGDTNGLYDFVVRIPKYGYDYVSKYSVAGTGSNNDDVASVVYAGLQSKDASGNAYITTMQEMNVGVCANTNMWGSGTSFSNATVTDHAQIYDYLGETGNNALLAQDTDTLGISSFKLIDNRDDKPYLVRRLADGNCWMVQNLDLDLASFAGKTSGTLLTTENTNLSSDRTDLLTADGKKYWDPSASLVTKVGSSTGTHETIANTTTLAVELSTALANQYMYRGDSSKADMSSDLRRYWGSRFKADGTLYQLADPTKSYDANTNACESGSTWDGNHLVCVANNANSEVPRSYNNGSDWIDHSASSESSTSGSFKQILPETWDATHASGYLGDYYNWYAATAESGTYAQSSGSTNSDICPKGWELPTNGGSTTNKSWEKLLFGTYTIGTTSGTQTTSNNKYGTAQGPSLAMHSLPLSIPFSGYYSWLNGTLYPRGSYGHFWSRTAYSTAYARYLVFGGTAVYPQGSSGKVYGLSVRCVAQ